MITKEQLKIEIDNVDDNQLLDKIHQLIRNARLPQNTSPSLMAKLRSVQISAPRDFAENIDAYLNDEKTV